METVLDRLTTDWLWCYKNWRNIKYMWQNTDAISYRK